MAFSYITDPSGIKFNNLPSSGTKGLNYKPQYGNNEFEFVNELGVEPFVNAVEIDWNGAQLGDKEINTTGELLSH